jgi:hypothetical protein
MSNVAKGKPRPGRDLIVEAREIEALSLECGQCACRVEVPWDGPVPESLVCPCCAAAILDGAVAPFYGLFRAIGSSGEVRFRLVLRER